MIVKPRPGVRVRDPRTLQHIPETGIEVSDTDTFWARRLADGDVVQVQPKMTVGERDEQQLPAPRTPTKPLAKAKE